MANPAAPPPAAPQQPVLKPASNTAPAPRPTSSSSSHRDSLTLARPPSTPSANRSSSLAENFRHPHHHHHNHAAAPGSPRASRTPSVSLSQAAVNELLNNPPSARAGDPAFAGRDWRSIVLDEVIDRGQARFVGADTSVEDAIELLIRSGSPNVLLLREGPGSRVAVGTFDYSDLNAYLLLGIGLKQPDEHQVARVRELARKGREGKLIPVKDVKDLGPVEPLLCVSRKEPLPKVVEIFGSGMHRVVVVEEDSNEVVGVLTQLRLVEFFWENCRHFARIEPLFSKTIRELEVGSHSVFAINGDKPLATALEMMYNEAVTSLPVLDNQKNVVGNISLADVRLLVTTNNEKALKLLRGSCIAFISVILSERGVTDGKDTYPVFYVNPYSTLAHTVAKLVATRSHRMWVVENPSPASSGPPTPSMLPAVPTLASSTGSLSSISLPPTPIGPCYPSLSVSTTSAPSTSAPSPASSVTASGIPGAGISGRLNGVVSLTDILNLFARASGLNPLDPAESRRQRRRSSSSSVRRSVESSRSESVGAGSAIAGELSRRGSVSGRR